MLKISKLTDYATVLLARLSVEDGKLFNVQALAQKTQITAPTVAKIMKSLQQAGLVHSARGALGGYELARSADQISAADIIDAVEGPQGLTDCAAGACDRESDCQVGHSWQRVHQKIRQTLEGISLQELANPTTPYHPPLWVSLGERPQRRVQP